MELNTLFGQFIDQCSFEGPYFQVCNLSIGYMLFNGMKAKASGFTYLALIYFTACNNVVITRQ